MNNSKVLPIGNISIKNKDNSLENVNNSLQNEENIEPIINKKEYIQYKVQKSIIYCCISTSIFIILYFIIISTLYYIYK
jgi:hypothetical protein